MVGCVFRKGTVMMLLDARSLQQERHGRYVGGGKLRGVMMVPNERHFCIWNGVMVHDSVIAIFFK